MSDESHNKDGQSVQDWTSGKTAGPLWIMILLVVLAWMGGIYLDRTSGGFNPEVYAPYPSYAYVKDVQGGGDLPPNWAKGKELFNLACAGCHQPTGMGAAGVAPPLAGSDWVLAAKPDRIARVVYNGLKGPIELGGQPFNAAGTLMMLNMGQQMGYSVDDMAAVLTYIRMNPDWGNDGSAVKASDIAAAYDAAKARSTQWTAKELQAIPVE